MERVIPLDRDVVVSVQFTDEEFLDTFRPVTLIVSTGQARIQTYLDPEECRALADSLRDVANGVDGHDDALRAERRQITGPPWRAT